ncbi:STAS domain-containing protein [Streptomyces sp. NPDC057939]|uniref:STAS domain-containing protein n=1 Tax=Streptomyces sp. NPDC057939 TaxID=3346284 RepID=UPI0036EEC8DF
MIGDREDTDTVMVGEITPDGVIVIRVRGDLDDDSSPALARALTAATADSGCSRTVVDLSMVAFADSSALHALLTARQAHTAAGNILVLAGPVQAAVNQLFEVTSTGPVFRWADNVQQAMTC